MTWLARTTATARGPGRPVALLGLAQTLSWASSFYLPAMLATPMAAELGVSRPTVFAVLSMALVVSALISPWAGRQIDRRGGRAVLMVYLAFSAALVVSAAVGPAAGRAIDRHGGRPVLLASNGVFALGLVLLALAEGPLGLFAAWAVLGLAMGSGLYEIVPGVITASIAIVIGSLLSPMPSAGCTAIRCGYWTPRIRPCRKWWHRRRNCWASWAKHR